MFSRPVSSSAVLPTQSGRSVQASSNAANPSNTQNSNAATFTTQHQNHGPSFYHPLTTVNEGSYPLDPTSAATQTDWYPFTLRWYFLLLPIFLSLGFGLSLIGLHLYSRQHNGLGKDNGSSMVLFAWRFAPTLAAVLYTQVTVIIFEDVTVQYRSLGHPPSQSKQRLPQHSFFDVTEDVKRTEPFARLAKAPSSGATAYGTLLQTPKSWWSILNDIVFRRKSIGKTGWSLILALIVHVLALLAISPLSSALLATDEVVVPRTFEFTRLSPVEGNQITMNATRDAYLRIMASVTRNISDSAWSSDSSFTFSFWPSSEEHQVESEILSEHGSWEAETTIYSTDFSCEDMTLEKAELRNLTYQTRDWHNFDGLYNGTHPMVIYTLNSGSGCQYELSLHPMVDLAYSGGLMWSDASTFNPTDLPGTALTTDGLLIEGELTDTSPYARVNASDECKGRDIILASTPWTEPALTSDIETMYPSETMYHQLPGFKMRGLLCNSTYFSTTGTVKMSMVLGEQTLLEHVSEATTDTTTLSDADIDLTGFQAMSTDDKWRYYFGELKFQSPEEVDSTNDETVAQSPAASGLGVILGMHSNSSVPHMIEDPKLVATARRIKGRVFTEAVRDSLSRPEMLKNETLQGTADILEKRVVVLPQVSIALCVLFMVSFFLLLSLFWCSRSCRRPLQLRSDPGSTVGLSTLLDPKATSLATLKKMHRSGSSSPAVLLLHTFATGSKLYQKAFTYETDLSNFGLSLSSFAPISIAPAAISIVITLWWDQIDATFRLLQPYIAMSQEPTPMHRGAGLTHRSKTWFSAAVKAAKHRHWILFMVAIGSTLCQVLTVSMSALFERRMDNVSQQVSVNKTLQMRYYPLISTQIEAQNSSSSWLYNAVMQLSLNSSQLTWAKDEWSFIPFDLLQTVNSTDCQSPLKTGSSAASSSKVTVTTPAIRVRIHCDTIPAIRNTSSWLGSMNVWSAKLLRNETGFQNFMAFRRSMFEGTPANTTLFTSGTRVQCCRNGTNGHSDFAAIGHWSPTWSSYPYDQRIWPLTFVPKWVLWKPKLAWFKQPDLFDLVFTEKPKLQAALCQPIVETTEASVLVDQDTGAGIEDVTNNIYNFRDKENGLNLDLMTYSMYVMAGKNPEALLNYTTLVTYANRTLQTFFQHFVQNRLNLTKGGNVYQSIDDESISKIGLAINENGTVINQPVYPAMNSHSNLVPEPGCYIPFRWHPDLAPRHSRSYHLPAAQIHEDYDAQRGVDRRRVGASGWQRQLPAPGSRKRYGSEAGPEHLHRVRVVQRERWGGQMGSGGRRWSQCSAMGGYTEAGHHLTVASPAQRMENIQSIIGPSNCSRARCVLRALKACGPGRVAPRDTHWSTGRACPHPEALTCNTFRKRPSDFTLQRHVSHRPELSAHSRPRRCLPATTCTGCWQSLFLAYGYPRLEGHDTTTSARVLCRCSAIAT
ncbi:hypothetical protein BU23DRAFT_624942 [Bimuria novae-zelandiae CBS 107.79]|uniref:Uncharacterized protein n=1 Tax=Bimuria novae-zelandiae CBS 107.79 TaxID=1447943 RepID=A0A6A5W3K4_9PLEO|nr:hypothetical protein BU23DRAFT_624942 [Bimuria novae-zelandiae CBS 107.79]